MFPVLLALVHELLDSFGRAFFRKRRTFIVSVDVKHRRKPCNAVLFHKFFLRRFGRRTVHVFDVYTFVRFHFGHEVFAMTTPFGIKQYQSTWWGSILHFLHHSGYYFLQRPLGTRTGEHTQENEHSHEHDQRICELVRVFHIEEKLIRF